MPEQANLKPLLTAGEVNELLAEVYPQLNGQYEFYRGGERVSGRLRRAAERRSPASAPRRDGFGASAVHPGRHWRLCLRPVACRANALSVTTGININFMRKAPAGPIDGHCRILKLGRTLMVFDIDIVAGPDRETVAHATGTYSIPPRRAKDA